MNRFSFFLAFNVFVIISLFVYHYFPKEWRSGKWSNVVLIIYHVIGVLSLELTFLIYKDIPYPWLQRLGTVVSTFYYVPIMIMAIFFGIGAVLRFIYYLICKKHPERRYTGRIPDAERRAVVTASAAYLLTVIGFINAGGLRTAVYDVDLPDLEREEPLKICFFADIHAGSGNWDNLYDKLIDQINAMEPDVILIGGDVFDETTGPHDMEKVAEVLQNIDAPLGVYYTLGNHDDPESQVLNEVLLDNGAVNIEESQIFLDEGIRLVGRKDDGLERMDAETLLSSVHKDDAVIVMEHRPTQFKELAENGADLVMAGHTHGFNIPMIAAVYWKADLVYGRAQYDDMTAIVTSGVSGWGFHYKCPAKNEVVLINVY